MRVVLLLLACIVGSATVAAAAPKPPGKKELRAISDRGKRLTAYDQAAWHAGDAIAELSIDTSKVTNYIAQERRDGTWRVVYGKRSDADDAFLIAYEATQSTSPTSFVATEMTPAAIDTDFFLRASRAIDTARDAFGVVQRPYNFAILPTAEGGWLVYVFPASTSLDAWPIGGDERYTITADGRQITESRRLHKSIVDVPPSPDVKTAAGVHTHILACIPEDTDVLAVMSRRSQVPEYIVCDPFSYSVYPDGSVRFMGHSKELWGIESEKKK